MQKIVLVIPIYNEEPNLAPLTERIRRVMSTVEGLEWELLLVDDGSHDGSWQEIARLARADGRISGLGLSRNFGKEMALTAGVEAAGEAEAVICLDADGEHPPELIPRFIAEWRRGAEIVVGVRTGAEGFGLLKKLGSWLFNALLARYSDIKVMAGSTDFRLLDCQVVRALKQFPERARMFRGLVDWMGFNKVMVEFVSPARGEGRPSYDLSKLFTLALNSFTSFSLLPLHITGGLGLLVVVFSILLLVVMIVTDVLGVMDYQTRAYFVVFILLLVGVVLSALGLIALYIGHINTEVMRRPLYIVRRSTGGQTPPQHSEPPSLR
ncbi:MAG: glycosyltransferase [Desulfarculus sp.]|nr:MAG: glycosyltransferase [Desulfarculus sp.]